MVETVMKKFAFALAMAGAVAGLMSGCASAPALEGSPNVTVTDATVFPSPTGIVDDPAADVYRIGALDLVLVDVLGFETLTNRRFQVDASGHISIPIGGSISVGGLTAAEAEQRIRQRLRDGHVRNPQVSVNLDTTNSRYVTVDGEVAQPGNYPMVSNMTLIRSIAAARGAGEFARLEQVVVFRTVNGQRMAALYDLAAIRRGAYADPRVYAQDVIVVGNSSARRLFRSLVEASTLLTGPLIAILNTSTN
jgi:polysaccharide biosynthesis/export protein